MGAPGLTSPIRTEAFQRLQLNAGIFLEGFDHADITDADALKTAVRAAVTEGTKLLGVTRDGGSFVVTREVRNPAVDGVRYAFKGQDFTDSMDGHLTGTLLEVTPENFKRLLSQGEITKVGKKTTVRVHTAVQDNDYLTKLCWIGDIADGRLVLIELDNAFNTADFSLTFSDKGEGTMPFEFHARQEDVLDYDYAPFRVIFFDLAETAVTDQDETDGTEQAETGGT